MSAWIVGPKTINRILYSLSQMRDGWIKSKITEMFLEIDPKWDFIENPTEIGKAMYSLNIDAVGARYGGRKRGDLPGSQGEYYYELTPCNDIQAYKSLRCWIYQCSEGDVPERPLYKAFEQIGTFIAEKIVNNLPQYDEADWG